jgi:hypothetical protein
LDTRQLKLGDAQLEANDDATEFVGFSKESLYKKLPVEERGKIHPKSNYSCSERNYVHHLEK